MCVSLAMRNNIAYCREEQGEGVDGTEASHANQHVDIDFPVFESLVDIFHVEIVSQMASIFSQPTLHFGALLRCEKSRTMMISTWSNCWCPVGCLTHVAG